MKNRIAAIVALTFLGCSLAANLSWGQGIVLVGPAVVPAFGPMVVPGPFVPPMPYVAAGPIVTASAYSTYRPIVGASTYVAPAPVLAYPRPVYSSYAPVVGIRPAVVRTKAYFPGQPVRNVLRAVTP